jgi:hypothetical protein
MASGGLKRDDNATLKFAREVVQLLLGQSVLNIRKTDGEKPVFERANPLLLNPDAAVLVRHIANKGAGR